MPTGHIPDETDFLTRLDHYPVPAQPSRSEVGLVGRARELAQAVCHAVRGQHWQAEASSPAWPSHKIDQHTTISVTVDQRWSVLLTETRPAGDGPEEWRITVNGKPVAHRPFPREAPHQAEAVARSVWRHLHQVTVEPCDSLMCDQPATVATWNRSTCPPHARPDPARPHPASAASPPSPQRRPDAAPGPAYQRPTLPGMGR